ncbi:unnamed protein product [Effrenium voratum]|nr:unnamed protein product [Effrenium voratum]
MMNRISDFESQVSAQLQAMRLMSGAGEKGADCRIAVMTLGWSTTSPSAAIYTLALAGAMFCSCCTTSAEPGGVEDIGVIKMMPPEAPPPLLEEQAPIGSSPPVVTESTAPLEERSFAEAQGAEFGFTLPDGSYRTVIMSSKPLGLDFYKAVPLIVKNVKPNSDGERVGIKQKWQLTQLDGEPVGGDLQTVMAQIAMTQDVDKKLSFLSSKRSTGEETGLDSLSRDVDAVKYDVGELKDLLNGAKSDTAHVKRIVMACERDMEDFTAAMDAVNVDLDEMRARVDSTHSIITSRQRVEATVTAEISTMRLDMGDMQEALKAHDAWMEDVSQSLQEVHERCQQLGFDINETNQQTQAKLDAKTDIATWNDMSLG